MKIIPWGYNLKVLDASAGLIKTSIFDKAEILVENIVTSRLLQGGIEMSIISQRLS